MKRLKKLIRLINSSKRRINHVALKCCWEEVKQKEFLHLYGQVDDRMWREGKG